MDLEEELMRLRTLDVRLYTKLRAEKCDIRHFFVLKFLSPTRTQGAVGACGHCSTIAAIEMLFRAADFRIDNSKIYCFDVVDLFNHAYRACRDVDDRERLRRDVSGDSGTSLSTIMSFIKFYGIKARLVRTDPLPRDLSAVFNAQGRKYKISSYKEVASSEVLQLVRHQPIIGTIYAHVSFFGHAKALYRPNPIDVEDKESKGRHAVLIVGFLKIKRNDTLEDFLIIQNSHGCGFGFLGFAAVPFDCQNMFTSFLAPSGPIIVENMQVKPDVTSSIKRVSPSVGKAIQCLYGGVPRGPQLTETPGRLNNILEMRRVTLHQVSYLVLDEAVKILNLGFEPHIRKIVKVLPSRRQTLMYTATWPEEVQRITGILVNNLLVNIGNVDELVSNKAITQFFSPMDERKQLEQISRSQEPGSKITIFCSAKKICDLAGNLTDLVGAVAIHGDKSQGQRDHVFSQFLDGSSPVLISTDIVARGLDIRVGRTGQADATGVPCTFFYYLDSKHASELAQLLEGANQRVPPEFMIAQALSSIAKSAGFYCRNF